MNVEPVHARMALAKSAAGFAVIVLIAVVGAGENIGHGAVHVAAAVAPPAAQTAQARRKQVFDERRQRFHGNAERRRVAEGKSKPADQPPVTLR